ncbi:hypothetical protein K1719_007180 [Acacia pycnantha]|nr:hypothetical protein K1719_007180 [Acacia pycnantha]
MSLIPQHKLRFFLQLSNLCSKTRLPSEPHVDPETTNSTFILSDNHPEQITSKSNHMEVVSSAIDFDESSCGEEALDANFTKPIVGDFLSTSKHVVDTLLSYKNQPTMALKFFREIERKWGSTETVDAFCLLLHILSFYSKTHGVARDMLSDFVVGHPGLSPNAFVRQLVECAGRYKLESSSRVVNYLLNGYVKANKIKDAVDCFKMMVDQNIDPWVHFMNNLLRGMVKRNMIDEALDLYDEMIQRRIYGDCFTLDEVMSACLAQGYNEKAEKYFREFRASGPKLDALGYDIVIQAACKWPNLKLMCSLLNDMQDMGWGNVTTALKLFNEIVEAGFALTRVLSLFDQRCSKIGNIKKAYEIFSQMKLMDIQPTSFIFNCLLNGFLKQDLQEDANRLFDEAVEHGIANVVTYNVLLTWLCDQGKIVEASNLWDKMIVKGIAPSIVSYNMLMMHLG